MPNVAPMSVAELRARYGVTVPESAEVIKWPVYHYQAYAAAGFTSLTFFGTAGTDFDLNNMEAVSSFPSPKSYLLRGLAVHFIPGAAVSTAAAAAGGTIPGRANDVIQALFGVGGGHLELLIGNKQYLFGAPLGIFPSIVPITGQAAVHFTQAVAANQQQNFTNLHNGVLHRDSFQLDPPLHIPPQLNFSVVLKFTTAQTIGTASTIGVVLLGQLIRPQQ